MVHRFVFTTKLNTNVNSAGHLNFVLMEEESQAVGTVAAEITVNTTKQKSFYIVCGGSQICSHNRQKSSCKKCREIKRKLNDQKLI